MSDIWFEAKNAWPPDIVLDTKTGTISGIVDLSVEKGLYPLILRKHEGDTWTDITLHLEVK